MDDIFVVILTILLLSNAEEVVGQNRVTGEKGVVYVNNRDTATFKWSFNFPLNEVGHLEVTREDKNGNVIGSSLLYKFSGGQYQLNDKSQYRNQLQYQTPQNGLEVIINNIVITDEGFFKCSIAFVDGSPRVENRTQLVVVVQPVINKDYKSLQKTEDEFASLLCKADAGNPRPLNFQWKKRDEKGNYQPYTSVVKAYDRYDLNITRVSRESRGDYLCLVTNRGGEDRHIVTLQVRYKPVVVKLSKSRTVFEENGETEFNCEADGNAGDTEYIWYQEKAIPENDIDQILKNDPKLKQYLRYENDRKRLKFLKPPRTYKGMYFCAGKNDLGTGQANGTYLNITYVPGDIIIQTENGIINGDENSNLTVECKSDANPPASYTWQKFYKDPITNTQQFVSLVDESYTGLLQLYNLTTNDTGEYKCIAVNYPNIRNVNEKGHSEKTVEIKVRYGPRQTNLTINNFNYSRIEIKEDTKFELKCESHSEPPATYNIQRKPDINQLNSDSSSGLYVINKMKRDLEGTYLCIARNTIMGNEEIREVEVVVAVPPKARDPIPADRKVQEKSTSSIICQAEGKPPPLVQWQKYGANITGDDVIRIIYTKGTINYEKITTIESKLQFDGIRYTDSASYSCIIYNSAGKLNITTKREVQYAPKITVLPKNFTVREGDQKRVNFVCDAIAHPLPITWSWYFDDGMNKVKELSPQTASPNTFTREIPNRDHNGVYTCSPSNSIGKGDQASARLIVQYTPIITLPPKEEVIVDVSEDVTLTCDANGVPEPQIKWEKQSTGSSFESVGKTLKLRNVQVDAIGYYVCSAKNVAGGDTKRSKVIVRHVPIITSTNPAETKVGVKVGEIASIVCTVNSYPPAEIKWTYASGTRTGFEITDGNNGFEIVNEKEEFGAKSSLKVLISKDLQGSQFKCEAKNTLGKKDQIFQILAKGKPEPPSKLTAEDKIQATIPVTVNVTFTWIPGFGGGYPVDYILLYKEENEKAFSEQYLDAPEGNRFVFRDRKTATSYIFSMKAKNKLGYSAELRPYVKFTTRSPPPDVVKASIKTRLDGTSVTVDWEVLQVNQWKRGVVRYRMVDKETKWQNVDFSIDKTQINGTQVIQNLNGAEKYEFHIILYDTNNNFGNPFDMGSLYPNQTPRTEERAGLSQTDIIAIAVGIGAFLLIITIIVLCIAVHRRKKEKQPFTTTYNNGRVQVEIPSSTVKSGYSDVVRGSYLHDEDPFAADTSSIIDDHEDKSPPPGYHDNHNRHPPEYDHREFGGTFRNDDPTPSYTSFGRLPKNPTRSNHDRAEVMDPLLRKSINDLDDTYHESERNKRSNRNSRDIYSDDEHDMSRYHGLRSPPSDEGNLNNRVPGAFGDRGNNLQRPKYPPSKYGDPQTGSLSPGEGHYQSGRSSPPSSVASSKPYRSDNEYIDDADDTYVGYLV